VKEKGVFSTIRGHPPSNIILLSTIAYPQPTRLSFKRDQHV